MVTVPLLRWLCLGAAVLVTGHVAGLALAEAFGFSREYGVLRQFNLNGEANLAAWFYSCLLLACAALVGVLALAARARASSLAPRWGALALVLLLMAVDESAQLHDMATGPLRRFLDIDLGAFYYAWLLPAAAFLVLAGFYFAPLVRSLTPAVAGRLVLAAALYFGGAVGFEMVSGIALAAGRESLLYQGVMTIEEGLELAGILVLLATLLAVARQQAAGVSLRFAGLELGIAPLRDGLREPAAPDAVAPVVPES
jgi:hypothetical protein